MGISKTVRDTEMVKWKQSGFLNRKVPRRYFRRCKQNIKFSELFC